MRRFILGWKVLGYARRFEAEIVNYADDFAASVDRSNPAIYGHRKTGHFRRPETGVEFYFTASSERKAVWTLVRQLRGPHLSTWA